MRHLISIAAAMLMASAAGAAKPDPASAPCGSEMCQLSLGPDARRLNDAFFSEATTDSERHKMHEIVAAHSKSGTTDWPSAAKEYFAWRASEPPSATPDAVAMLANAGNYGAASATADFDRIQRELQQKLRVAGEAAVKAQLIDPGSAQFEWPYGFILGTWKPFLARRVNGYWTCGRVNSRNRMGGYAGSSAFVVVLSEDGDSRFVDIDDGKYALIGSECAKSAALLPAARSEWAPAPVPTASVGSIADELEKLADLRDRGIITKAEFDVQKAKLLGEE